MLMQKGSNLYGKAKFDPLDRHYPMNYNVSGSITGNKVSLSLEARGWYYKYRAGDNLLPADSERNIQVDWERIALYGTTYGNDSFGGSFTDTGPSCGSCGKVNIPVGVGGWKGCYGVDQGTFSSTLLTKDTREYTPAVLPEGTAEDFPGYNNGP